ncbi:hypothetical protein G3M48_003990 [Beauveria asiatica]|uniref:Uncharacterized protein n=1 Tax=Beauveria asiatica TaxID=1069075 RepID=A0AAW0S640_9HYPO
MQFEEPTLSVALDNGKIHVLNVENEETMVLRAHASAVWAPESDGGPSDNYTMALSKVEIERDCIRHYDLGPEASAPSRLQSAGLINHSLVQQHPPTSPPVLAKHGATCQWYPRAVSVHD